MPPDLSSDTAGQPQNSEGVGGLGDNTGDSHPGPCAAYRRGMTTNTITLNNGVTMPALGLGVFQTPPDETRTAVEAALWDTANIYAYGTSEEIVGPPSRSTPSVTTSAWPRHRGTPPVRVHGRGAYWACPYSGRSAHRADGAVSSSRQPVAHLGERSSAAPRGLAGHGHGWPSDPRGRRSCVGPAVVRPGRFADQPIRNRSAHAGCRDSRVRRPRPRSV